MTGLRRTVIGTVPTLLVVSLYPALVAGRESPPEHLVVTGIVHRGGAVELEPFLVLEGETEPPPRVAGAAYAFELLDAGGVVLARADLDLRFEMETFDEKRSGVEAVEATPFMVTLPHPGGVVRARLRHGQTVLAARDRSAHAPTVTVVESGLDEQRRAISVRWRAEDRDGDGLTYWVWYARDGTSFETRAADVESTELQFDLAAHEAAPNAAAKVRVRASDGWNFAEATSTVARSGR